MQVSIDAGKEPTESTMIKLSECLKKTNDEYQCSKQKWTKDKKKFEYYKKKLAKREDKMKKKFNELENVVSTVRTNNYLNEIIFPMLKRHRDI